MADRVGQQLGNYQLIRLLGEGGFAEVYLGEHIHLGTQAAIKVLHTQLTSADVDKFRTEARTIARLIHPHIVRVLEFGIEGNTPFLVMEYAPHGTLRQRHPKGTRLPLATIMDYVKQVADALQHAHDEKLIHRDIKPENMLLGRRNDILLSDFGIALVVQSSRYQNAQGMAGTIVYMAPEQIQGKPSLASDQYSLGVVVYEWISGDRPFHGSLTELVGQHLSAPPPPLQEKVPTISSAVEQVVLTALAKDPKQRFGSVLAFATALEEACQTAQFHPVSLYSGITPSSQSSLSTDAILAISPSQLSQTTAAAAPSLAPTVLPPSMRGTVLADVSQQTKRRFSRRAVVLGLVGLAATGSGLTWLAFSRRQPISSAIPTPIPLGTTFLTYRGESPYKVDTIAWSPDGKRIASGGFGVDKKTAQEWDASTGGVIHNYAGHFYGARSMAWSPDGKYIASSDESDSITTQVWDATSGNHIFTYTGFSEFDPQGKFAGGVNSVAWSPNGKRIASGSNDWTVQIWDATTGSNPLIYHAHSLGVNSVAWSPDGKRIASGSADQTVQIWDAATGNHVFTYSGHFDVVNAVVWSPNGMFIASASQDKTVQVWSVATGSNILTYHGHAGSVNAVAWSPNGKRIASGSADTTVQVWDATSEANVFTYHHHAGSVNAVAWSPNGKRIASGSADTTVQVWQAS